MKKGYDLSLEMNVTTIFPGEFYATCQDELITTLLGSCISVVLLDPVNNVSGMNHFMLPGDSSCKTVFTSKEGKYGIFAMELLIDEMVNMGGCEKYFQAKVFGGGSVLPSYSDYTESVPVNNIRFVMQYLSDENIPVISSDIGGIEGRKVYFITEKKAVFVKKIYTPAVRKIQAIEEKSYINQISAPEAMQYEALNTSI
jgi:chemotaxis protein CheD